MLLSKQGSLDRQMSSGKEPGMCLQGSFAPSGNFGSLLIAAGTPHSITQSLSQILPLLGECRGEVLAQTRRPGFLLCGLDTAHESVRVSVMV